MRVPAADPATDLVDFFQGFELAASSEHKKLDKKLAKEALTVYDRIMSAQAEEILIFSKIQFGPANFLDRLSKLIAISQRVSASFVKAASSAEQAVRLTFVLRYLLARMEIGHLEPNVGVLALRSTELPNAIAAQADGGDLREVHIPILIRGDGHARGDEGPALGENGGQLRRWGIRMQCAASELQCFRCACGRPWQQSATSTHACRSQWRESAGAA